MKNEERLEEESVTFVGEQDGEVERDLKAAIVTELKSYPSVRRAYLSVVSYGASQELNVALCLFGSPEDPQAVQACAARFQTVFNPEEHLDILFLNAEQDRQVSQVCTPFFSRY